MSAAPLDVQIEIVLREFRARESERMGAGEVRWMELLRYMAWANGRLQSGAPGSRETGPGGPGAGGSGFATAEGRRRRTEELALRAAPLTQRLPDHAYSTRGYQMSELVRITDSFSEGIEVMNDLHTLVKDLNSGHARLGEVDQDRARLLEVFRKLVVLTWTEARRASSPSAR